MKLTYWLLAIACFGVLALRLFIAFQSPELGNDDAYFHLRQIEHIRQTGLPLFDDPLSYGGRTYFFSPVFHYVVAASSLFMSVALAAKIIPNILATLLVLIIFCIVHKLAKYEWVSLFIAVFSAFVPVWFGYTINTVSPITLSLPLLFFVLYAWLRVQEPRWRYVYIVSLVVFAFTHPLVLIFVLGLIIFLILALVSHMGIEKTEREVALFSVFFVLWSQFLLYKKLILAHGLSVIWQNIPPALLSSFFSKITILTAIYNIGFLPALYGVFVVYKYLFRRKHKMTYFLIAFALASGIVLWFRLIPLQLGLMLLGMFLLVLFSRWIDFFFGYIATTRFSRWQAFYVVVLVMSFILTSGLPAGIIARDVQNDAISSSRVAALEWIKTNTPENAVVVGTVNEGHEIAMLANRKNVIDSHFLLKHDAKQRFNDVNRIFTTTFGVEAAELLDRYGASVIFLSPETKQAFKISTLTYALSSPCFGRAFQQEGYEIFVKHAFCRVGVVE